MKGISRVGIFTCFFLLTTAALCAETTYRVLGESLTPAGTTIFLVWQVREENNRYRIYLDNRLKAEMVLKDDMVVKIRRHVRFAGKDKWIILKDPLQIALELKSGFYPFSAMLNYRKNKSRETILATGRFEILRSEGR